MRLKLHVILTSWTWGRGKLGREALMQGASSKVSAAFSLYGLELSAEKSSLSIYLCTCHQDSCSIDKVCSNATQR